MEPEIRILKVIYYVFTYLIHYIPDCYIRNSFSLIKNSPRDYSPLRQLIEEKWVGKLRRNPVNHEKTSYTKNKWITATVYILGQ